MKERVSEQLVVDEGNLYRFGKKIEKNRKANKGSSCEGRYLIASGRKEGSFPISPSQSKTFFLYSYTFPPPLYPV